MCRLEGRISVSQYHLGGCSLPLIAAKMGVKAEFILSVSQHLKVALIWLMWLLNGRNQQPKHVKHAQDVTHFCTSTTRQEHSPINYTCL